MPIQLKTALQLKPFIRNWFWPTVMGATIAALSALNVAYLAGGINSASDAWKVVIPALIAFLLTKFNAIAGKDQPYWEHKKPAS